MRKQCSRLQLAFVNEDPENARDEIDDGEDEGSPQAEEPQRSHSHSHSRSHQEASDPKMGRQSEPEILSELPIWSADEPSNPIPQPSIAMFSDKDESAVAGLLALGTSTTDTIGPEISLSEFTISPPARERSLAQVMAPINFTEYPVAFSPGQHQLPQHTAVSPEMTPTETLELLRHYRYEVAPWLAMVSPPVRDTVLALSKASIDLLRPHPSHSRTEKDILSPITPDEKLDITTVAFLRALDKTKQCITDMPLAWSLHRESDTEILEPLSAYTIGRDLNSAIYWLYLRLDLGAALAADTSLRVPIPPSSPYFADGDLGGDPFGLVFSYAHRPLWLCARAVEFMHNEDPSPHLPPLPAWMQVVEELEQWYRERPQGFQPMLEIETDNQAADPGESFPVVLFANGAGVLSNQLYHTAMLLLLRSRPRTAHIADIRSATMSPLWHAQRICSIALNNERRECWDPCLLASFLTAARRMTHESQQQEILRGFERIRKITGWDARALLRDLQVEWGWPEA
ncbi:uncharacterized protein N7473_006442 [Penicillium subrubescens]|uniref:uncharacterized protein n=1 Tax=Penicillium subrubescens TaxID=1316194 RepID=UPI002544EC26|nr:uncharacterized protein N7473_006442 [Penicillium subrubescens]KAJ5897043.1 hypothetical protein N7473_006442 [Penicillium subrubescens]